MRKIKHRGFFLVLLLCLGYLFSGCPGQDGVEKSADKSPATAASLPLDNRIKIEKLIGRDKREYKVCAGRLLVTTTRKELPGLIRDKFVSETPLISTVIGKDRGSPPGDAGKQKFVYLLRLTDPEVTTQKVYNELTDKLAADPEISIEPDYIIQAESVPVATNVTRQTDWRRIIKANELARETDLSDARESVVAVLDFGVNEEHLSGKVWTASWELPPVTVGNLATNCPAGSHGINFRAQNSGEICLPRDGDGHGTKVAGVITADGGILGSGTPAVEILPIRVIETGIGCLGDAISGWDFIARLNDAIDRHNREDGTSLTKVTVVNNSFGCPLIWQGNPPNGQSPLNALSAAIGNANQNGLLLIASAGNDGNNINQGGEKEIYPASLDFPNLIAVAATEDDDRIFRCEWPEDALCSNYGNAAVDIAAPGRNIPTVSSQGDPVDINETSAAAPVVSASAALLLSICHQNLPATGVNAWLRNCLRNSAQEASELGEKIESKGRVDVFNAALQCGCIQPAP